MWQRLEALFARRGNGRAGLTMLSDLYSFSELHRHYRNCRRNKRNTMNALAFEIDAEANLLRLQRELRDHTYRPGRSICFITDGPKPREVFAADFRDRVVHHLLVWHQERIFEPRFVRDSYACRRGKGTLAASDRLMTLLRRITANGQRPAWALKLDVASFFPSIHKQTLCDIIERQVRHPELRWLTRTILFHDPTTDYRFRSLDGRVPAPGNRRYPIPGHKSLFGKHNECGLPIGNLTSQFWANVYLNELDHFAKRHLKCRHYVRYVDDIVLLSANPAELCAWRDQIGDFLRTRLRLTLRGDQTDPFPIRQGVEFVGWKTWWNRRLVRRQTLGNLQKRLQGFERDAMAKVDPKGTVAVRLHASARQVRRPGSVRLRSVGQLHSVLASYSGHLRHGAAFADWLRVWAQHAWLPLLFTRHRWRVGERWRDRTFCRAGSFRRQYAALLRSAGWKCLMFCFVGRFVEFYGPQRLIAERVLGLKRTYRPRGGFAFAAGFPVFRLPMFRQRALDSGVALVEIREQGADATVGCRRRRMTMLWIPAGIAGRDRAVRRPAAR